MTPYHEQVFQSWMEQTATGREFHPSPENFQRLEDAFIKFKMQSFAVANLVTVAEKMQREGRWLYVTKRAFEAREQSRAEQEARDERARQERVRQAVAEDARQNQPPPPPQLSPEQEFEQRRAAAWARFDETAYPSESSFERLKRVGRQREQWMRQNVSPPAAPSQQAHPETIRRTQAELRLRQERADRQREARLTPTFVPEPSAKPRSVITHK
jgi:hypothetical protein